MKKNKHTFKFALTALLLSYSAAASASVWTANRNWTDADEARFSQFISSIGVDKDTYKDEKIGLFKTQKILIAKKGLNFFLTDPDFSGIPTDCADAAYTLRTIFAFRNGLPVSYGGGKLTNSSDEFDGIQDPVKRVRKFIATVNNSTDTNNLISDTYPIAINRNFLRPGSMYLKPQGDSTYPESQRSGHVYYVRNVADNGIIGMFSSTVPAAIREMNPTNGLSFAPLSANGGFRNWKWPHVTKQQGESNEQFTPAFGGWKEKAFTDGNMWNRWSDAIENRLKTRTATPWERVVAREVNLRNVISERSKAINKAWAYYEKVRSSRKCLLKKDPKTGLPVDEYENHSTPSRDAKVQGEFVLFNYWMDKYIKTSPGLRELNALLKEDGNGESVSPMADKAQLLERIYKLKRYQFEVAPGLIVNMNQIKKAFVDYHLQISEPEHEPKYRWGFEYLPVSQWPCPERAEGYTTKKK